ncbi:low molecular weight protein arginine phosphatase [Alkalihalobacillus sp. LMS39]|uniref:low molecular weight protein arginine phosphatase n=1 Tax=Alkalihalobacillus sp. LMS39 TaxID=2924032 RepID=UPI001FB41C8C|nr:low molecular weight protein arginine phosphatase [Alkalihalobacillus sp. LMS39]UOE93954.1 low molecular weight protein arginine phosphatase [Alkalihalobacillus sp. LMS39]
MVNILFVCTGNTCRSPLAEKLLREKINGDIAVRSAGIYAAIGSGASEGTKQVLAERGIDGQHQSSPLTDELLHWATVVLTMTESHKQTIILNAPYVSEKVYTLKEFVQFGEGDVIDPFGHSVEAYRKTAAELEQLVDRLIEKYNNEQ